MFKIVVKQGPGGQGIYKLIFYKKNNTLFIEIKNVFNYLFYIIYDD